MYSFIYILTAFIVAVSAGVYLYREHQAETGIDYIPAIAAGFLWPLSAALFALAKLLDAFKSLCIQISNGIDEAAEQRLEKEAAKAKEP